MEKYDKNVFNEKINQILEDFKKDISTLYDNSTDNVKQKVEESLVGKDYCKDEIEKAIETLVGNYSQSHLISLIDILDKFKLNFKEKFGNDYLLSLCTKAAHRSIEKSNIEKDPMEYTFNRLKSEFNEDKYKNNLDNFIRDYGVKAYNWAFNEAVKCVKIVPQQFEYDKKFQCLNNIVFAKRILCPNDNPEEITDVIPKDWNKWVNLDDYDEFITFAHELATKCNNYLNDIRLYIQPFYDSDTDFSVDFFKYTETSELLKHIEQNPNLIHSLNDKDRSFSFKNILSCTDDEHNSFEVPFYVDLDTDRISVKANDEYLKLYKVNSVNYSFNEDDLQSLKKNYFIADYMSRCMAGRFNRYCDVIKTKEHTMDDLLFEDD